MCGIVYEVSESDMLMMDAFEDGYSRYQHSVYSFEPNSSVLEAIVYIAPKEISVPLPNAEYKRLMLEGARHWQLPTDYCAMLAQLKAAEERQDLIKNTRITENSHRPGHEEREA